MKSNIFLPFLFLLIFMRLGVAETEFKGVQTEISESDRQILESYVGHMQKSADQLNAEKLKTNLETKGPEAFCWVDFRYLDGLNTAYALTKNSKYLDLFRESFALYESLLSKGPDEYLGWYGPTIDSRKPNDNPDLKVDEIQTNFRAIDMLARWVALARSDAEYAEGNAETIDRYLKLMEEQLFPKWDARKHFIVIPGRGGLYRWLDYPIREGTSLSFEKLSIMVDGMLSLYRVTENPVYMKRALQIGAWYKSNLILKDGHYEWMSWVPGGEWDIHPEKDNAWRIGWMAPDPNAEWYITSLSIAMIFYRHGILFTDQDLQRFIKTQKEMCWNGDMVNPEYRAVDGSKGKWTKGRFLSPTLANYDSEIEKLAFNGPHEAQQLANAENSWKGAVGADRYIREKFLLRNKEKPFAGFGRKFLEDPSANSFLAQIDRPVNEGDTFPPRTPSVWFIQP